jgi:hypothetical protein
MAIANLKAQSCDMSAKVEGSKVTFLRFGNGLSGLALCNSGCAENLAVIGNNVNKTNGSRYPE